MSAKVHTGGVIDTLPGDLPIADLPDSVDADAVASSFLPKLGSLSAPDCTKDVLWRDTYALTGTTRTFFSAAAVESAWKDVSAIHHPSEFSLIPNTSHVAKVGPESSWIEAGFTFKTNGTPASSCSGFVSLVPDNEGGWKVWLLRTILEQLDGLPDVDTLQPQTSHANGTQANLQERDEFDCVIVGGGPAGMCQAGRLQALGISYVVIDRNAEVGDSWMTRYDSVKLHTVRPFANLPFERTFSPDYPNLLNRHHMQKEYKRWVDKFGINMWLSTSLESGSWDKDQQSWTLHILRHGKPSSLKTKHLIMAIGNGGQIPKMPSLPGQDKFAGEVLHSADYKSAWNWKGKAAVVIGSGCTAHDISEDMLEAELSSVTMVQRGTTFVIASEHYHKITSGLYNDTLPTETADRIQFSTPVAIARQRLNHNLHAMVRADPDRFDALERKGFKTQRYGDVVYHLNERLGGFYMDVGASAKIIDGRIKVKSNAAPTAFNERGLVFDDGSTVPADAVIFCTGFVGTIRGILAQLLGQETADQVDECWGLDEEGELYGVFKPTGHPGLWYAGGTLGHQRFLSRFLAMQLKARLLGTPLPVYNKRQVAN